MDGEEVNIWEDRWVQSTKIKWSGNMENGRPHKVSKLIDSNEKKWQPDSIKEHILDEQVKAIMEVPICRSGGNYRLVWPNSKNGEQTVKTGYHTLKDEEIADENRKASGSHYVKEKVWKKIWKLPIVLKVRNFMWRASGNYLLQIGIYGREG